MKKIAVLTSGGDSPGMNAAIRAVVRAASAHNLEVLGVKNGYQGLLTVDWVHLDARSVANILQRGGTILGTSRCQEMKTPEGRHRVAQTIRAAGIEGLITIGGDGTTRGATALFEEEHLKVVGVPSTIDNDLGGTDYTIGFDTALNTALEAIDRIRDTAESLSRIFFVEVMGRSRGFLALEVGIAGGADEILIPETETTIDKLCQVLTHSFARGKRSALVVVAEGDVPGGALEVARQVKERLGIDQRVCVLGHVQRGGSPTARDRILASKLGAAAVEALLKGREGYLVGEIRGDIVTTPLRQAWEQPKELNSYLQTLLKVMAT